MVYDTPENPKKRCSRCDLEFPATLEFFGSNKRKPDGLHYYCRKCAVVLSTEFRRKHPEKTRELRRKIAKRERLEHPELSRERKRRYNTKHRDRINASKRRYRHENPHQIQAEQSRRAARRKGAKGSYTLADVELQIKSQTDSKGILHCWWCGKPITEPYHIDHRIPLIRGGSNGPENIVISHGRCNLKKGTKTPGEYLDRLL